MTYEELRANIQTRINELPIKFAFSNQQFKEAMRELGLAPTDTDKVRSIGSIGGFCLASDVEMIKRTFRETAEEMQRALDNDDEFCIDAIRYELANHEFCYTYDPDDTMEALGLSLKDSRIKRLYRIAKKLYLEEAISKGWLD